MAPSALTVPRAPFAALIERLVADRDDHALSGTERVNGGGIYRLAAELSAHSGSEEGWARWLGRARTGATSDKRTGRKYVQETLFFSKVDEMLAALDLTHLWFTEYAEYLPEAPPPDTFTLMLNGERFVVPLETERVCADCGKECDEADFRPLDLMRPDPYALHGVVWDTTHRRWVRRPKNARAGGRRFRVVPLCRRCAGEALRIRATKSSWRMEGGKRVPLHTRDRVAPKRGGRPKLLTESEVRAAHAVYVAEKISMLEVARRIAAKRAGTALAIQQLLRREWEALGLPIRARGEQIGISRHGTDGTKSKPWKQQCKAKKTRGRKRSRCTNYVRRIVSETGSRPAEDGLCWNHALNTKREVQAA